MMQTLRLTSSPEDLARAAEILRSGGLVAFPTETVYGLGANALDPAAVTRIFAAKQRPDWDPVIVHIADAATLPQITTKVPPSAQTLIDRFWPGPLTLLLPRSPAISDLVTAGRPLVGVRMPAHPVAFELIRLAGIPIAAPSANRFGHTSPTTAEHVLADLDGRIDAIVDAGPTLHGVESTVLDATQNPIMIYRPGAVTLEQIRATAGAAILYEPPSKSNNAEAPKGLPSPGVGIRHYAPRAHLILIEAPDADLPTALAQAATSHAQNHAQQRLGILLPREFAQTAPPHAAIFDWGSWFAPEELAARLYAGLRELDAAGCDLILCPLPSAEGIGTALRDRLRKAAWKNEKA
jgi:L-threonylcarbamoyladenylate synthase